MRLALALLALAAGAPAHAATAEDVAKLSWLAGSWVENKVAITTRETWLPPGGGVMGGVSQTYAQGRKPFIEHMKITAEPAGVTFTAVLAGQPPTPFVMKPGSADGEVVFENLGHDFPQRVIYSRCGEQLCARIEGVVKGEPTTKAWIYSRVR